jgi:hypothetical protein
VGVLGSAATGRTPEIIEAPSHPMALPLPTAPPDPETYRLAPQRIKRCTFRRLIQIESGADRLYDVDCLLPDRRVPIPLGDLDSAAPICNSCTAAHTFRPDED